MNIFLNICRKLLLIIVLFACCGLSACATYSADNPADPYESYNRKVFAFNMVMDKTVLRPIAKSYEFVTPNFVQHRVTHVFANLDNVTTVFNDFLQFKFAYASVDLWRLVINSTLGLGGMFDVASKFGLPKHNEDFGLTLAYWGAPRSSFFVAPLLGPSTLRDTFGSAIDLLSLNYAIWRWINPSWLQWGLYGLELVNKRANLLVSDPLVDQAFDPYAFVRDAYMQQRNQQIAANKVPFAELYQQPAKAKSAADNFSNG